MKVESKDRNPAPCLGERKGLGRGSTFLIGPECQDGRSEMAGKGEKRLKSSMRLARKRGRSGVQFQEERRDQELPHVGLECLWYDVMQSRTGNYSVLERAGVAKLRGCGASGFPSPPFRRFGRTWSAIPTCSFVSFPTFSYFKHIPYPSTFFLVVVLIKGK